MPALTVDDPQAASVFERVNAIEQFTRDAIRAIPSMSDAQITDCIICANALETAAFVIRGAAVCELKKRVAVRLAGGRGHVDEEGIGVRATLASMAREVGCAAQTLADDGRIYEAFGERLVNDADPLPRDFYRTALSLGREAGAQALDLAERKRAVDAGYSRDQFRADVASLRAGDNEEIVEETRWIAVPLDAEAWELFAFLQRRWRLDRPETVRRLIFEAWDDVPEEERE